MAWRGVVLLLSCAVLLLGGCAGERYVISGEEAAAAVAALRTRDETVVRAVDEKAGAQVRLRLRADDLVTLRQAGEAGDKFRLGDLTLDGGSSEIVFEFWPRSRWNVNLGTAFLLGGIAFNIGMAIYAESGWFLLPYVGSAALIMAPALCPKGGDCPEANAYAAVGVIGMVLQVVGPLLLMISAKPNESRVVDEKESSTTAGSSLDFSLNGTGLLMTWRF